MMHRQSLAGYDYLHVPHASATRALILLHGTGGDAVSMLDIGRDLDPKAHLLSIQGNVLEHGANRFFKRVSEGVYDVVDLAQRTEALATFIPQVLAQHGIADMPTCIVGYSNGANIAVSLLLSHPNLCNAYVLIRPLFPHEPEHLEDLSLINILLLAGTHDQLATEVQTTHLSAMLYQQNARISTQFSPAGHELTLQDLAYARQWLTDLDPRS
jgi:phospholipase/carboxylesterase